MMRLQPIEKPEGLFLKLAYWISRRRFGGVMNSMKVAYARSPRIARTAFSMIRTLESGLSLDKQLEILILTQSSLINGCRYCADLHQAQALQARLGRERWNDLSHFRESPHFSERERAALAYTEEATRGREVADATFETLRKHFDEREIVEITWLNAIGNYFNLIAIPLGLEPDGFADRARARQSA